MTYRFYINFNWYFKLFVFSLLTYGSQADHPMDSGKRLWPFAKHELYLIRCCAVLKKKLGGEEV